MLQYNATLVVPQHCPSASIGRAPRYNISILSQAVPVTLPQPSRQHSPSLVVRYSAKPVSTLSDHASLYYKPRFRGNSLVLKYTPTVAGFFHPDEIAPKTLSWINHEFLTKRVTFQRLLPLPHPYSLTSHFSLSHRLVPSPFIELAVSKRQKIAFAETNAMFLSILPEFAFIRAGKYSIHIHAYERTQHGTGDGDQLVRERFTPSLKTSEVDPHSTLQDNATRVANVSNIWLRG